MEIPTWGKAVGILMLLFGGCGIMGDIKQINTPVMMELQQEIMEEVSAEIKSEVAEVKKDSTEATTLDSTIVDSQKSEDLKKAEEITDTLDNLLNISDYTLTWLVRLGYMGLFFSFIYMLGGLFLLIKKTFSIKIVYTALGLSIAFGIFHMIMLSNESSGLIGMATGIASIFGIIIDVILLVVVIISDKTAYFYYSEES